MSRTTCWRAQRRLLPSGPCSRPERSKHPCHQPQTGPGWSRRCRTCTDVDFACAILAPIPIASRARATLAREGVGRGHDRLARPIGRAALGLEPRARDPRGGQGACCLRAPGREGPHAGRHAPNSLVPLLRLLFALGAQTASARAVLASTRAGGGGERESLRAGVVRGGTPGDSPPRGM
eukprot:scaffold1475_cov346-Prasinococcus_capsulatus_cf.AAC.1